MQKHFGPLNPVDIKRLRSLEGENPKLNRTSLSAIWRLIRSKEDQPPEAVSSQGRHEQIAFPSERGRSKQRTNCTTWVGQHCPTTRFAPNATRRPWRR